MGFFTLAEWQSMLELSFLIFLTAFIGGFFSSIPLGPINLWIINSSLTQETRKAVKPFVIGVVLADAFFAFIAILGYYTIFKEVLSNRLIILSGGSFLLFLGVYTLFQALSKKEKKHQTGVPPKLTSVSTIKYFSLGLFLCGSNPGFLMFWVFFVGLSGSLFHTHFSSHMGPLFIAGVVLGDIFWFKGLSHYTSKYTTNLSSKLLRTFHLVASLVFITFGVISIVRHL